MATTSCDTVNNFKVDYNQSGIQNLMSTKTALDASGNKLHSCNDGIMLSELPLANMLPASLSALKNDVCVSLPNMNFMKA